MAARGVRIGLGVLLTLTGLHAPALALPGLFWTDTGTDKVQRSGLDGANVDSVLDGASSFDPHAVALDVAAGKVYWTDDGAAQIQRSNPDGSGFEVVTVLPPGSTPRGLALDVLGGKVYWTEASTRKIQRSNLDGTEIEDVLGDLGNPGSIDLDVAAGRMYWTDRAALLNRNVIVRANLDGSEVAPLALEVVDLAGLALDVAAGKIYWGATQTIRRANLDGSDVEDVVLGQTEVRGIALHRPEAWIYWTDSGSKAIRRARLADGAEIEDLVTLGLDSPRGIALEPDVATPTASPSPTGSEAATPEASPTPTPTLEPTLEPTATAIPTATAEPTVTHTATPTHTPTVNPTLAACIGNCDRGPRVTTDELLLAVRIGLGLAGVEDCSVVDRDHDDTVKVDELVAAASNAVYGCGVVPPTFTRTRTFTSTPTFTPTSTATRTSVPTWTPTPSFSPTATWTNPPTPTVTRTNPPTPTATDVPTPGPPTGRFYLSTNHPTLGCLTAPAGARGSLCPTLRTPPGLQSQNFIYAGAAANWGATLARPMTGSGYRVHVLLAMGPGRSATVLVEILLRRGGETTVLFSTPSFTVNSNVYEPFTFAGDGVSADGAPGDTLLVRITCQAGCGGDFDESLGFLIVNGDPAFVDVPPTSVR